MDHEFMARFYDCGSDTVLMSTLMTDIDAEKRQLKPVISQLARELNGNADKVHDRTEDPKVEHARLSSRVDDLKMQRTLVKENITAIKHDLKAFNRSLNKRTEAFGQAFVAAAERLLTEEQFLELELRAVAILEAK